MKVIYLTGAPASGKSSTVQKLVQADPSILRIEYGAELTKIVQARNSTFKDQEQLRRMSSSVVTHEDVVALDNQILLKIEQAREKQTIILDSHPVTKESYGYRITAFSDEKVRRMKPDEIWVFYASPTATIKRIEGNSGGRPMVTEEEARTHSLVQSSVAATYGIITGAPVYLFDTDTDQEKLVHVLLERLRQ